MVFRPGSKDNKSMGFIVIPLFNPILAGRGDGGEAVLALAMKMGDGMEAMTSEDETVTKRETIRTINARWTKDCSQTSE